MARRTARPVARDGYANGQPPAAHVLPASSNLSFTANQTRAWGVYGVTQREGG
jgi:hypothetical protein